VPLTSRHIMARVGADSGPSRRERGSLLPPVRGRPGRSGPVLVAHEARCRSLPAPRADGRMRDVLDENEGWEPLEI
jgi:hypothetical protein